MPRCGPANLGGGRLGDAGGNVGEFVPRKLPKTVRLGVAVFEGLASLERSGRVR